MIFSEVNNNFRLDISSCSNKNEFLKGKIIILDLTFQVTIIKWFLQRQNNNFKLDISGCSNKNDLHICRIKNSDLIF
jgi:hypothetical protein